MQFIVRSISFLFSVLFLFVSVAFALNDFGHENPFQGSLLSFRNLEQKKLRSTSSPHTASRRADRLTRYQWIPRRGKSWASRSGRGEPLCRWPSIAVRHLHRKHHQHRRRHRRHRRRQRCRLRRRCRHGDRVRSRDHRDETATSERTSVVGQRAAPSGRRPARRSTPQLEYLPADPVQQYWIFLSQGVASEMFGETCRVRCADLDTSSLAKPTILRYMYNICCAFL